MQRLMVSFSRRKSAAIRSGMASVFLAASTSLGVPIDLTDSTPSVTGVTTLHIEGIATLGSSYWADFEWNEKTNKFDVVAYGEEGDWEPPRGFVRIEAGTFTMGSPEDELGRDVDEPQHEVTLTRDFYIAEMEVTQAQWVSVMGSNPSYFPGCDECPVDKVSWTGAVYYCNALSALEGLSPAYEINAGIVTWDPEAHGYRLPTEAEWEYACRAGTTTAFYNGPIIESYCEDPNMDEIGWYCGNDSNHTEEVGRKPPNPWGLYDMSGNLWEWCWDWKDYYDVGPVVDPTGPDSGTDRVFRGGSWSHYALHCRSASRHQGGVLYKVSTVGFRPAISAP